MILYALKCRHGHEFEGWFRSSDDFDRESKRGEIECPACGTDDVEKAVMAPSVARTDERGGAAPAPPEALPVPRRRRGPPSPKEVETYFAAVRKHVENTFDYVGPEFPEEARKIHYGESEERGIYGEATPADARELAEEGIEIAPLPGARRRPRARMN